MSSNTVYVFQQNSKYPSPSFSFSPSKLYPEYPWDKTTLSKKNNDIYGMIRSILFGLGLDKKNYNKKKWNPFVDFIAPGMTVLIKPNMVLSFDSSNNDPSLKTLVTNPSLVRAIIDYVCIALKNKGKVVIADAPLQSCNFSELKKKMGYNKIIDFYKAKGVDIDIVDLRQYVSQYTEEGFLEPLKASCDPRGYTVVHLGDSSAHVPVRNRTKRFRVTNYDHRKMRLYHNQRNDSYLIANSVLNSDVIISLPKLKTHRKAGMTGALKNFIGIIGHKDCLPHHSTGSTQEGGDEYKNKNVYKKTYVKLWEVLNIAMINKKRWAFPFLQKLILKAKTLSDRSQKDPFLEGSWYGNDTIWRTTLDLVRIVLYADKKGVLKNKQQRKILTFVDGIIAGEKEGPLEPTPKKAGIIAGGLNPATLDLALTSIMGFDWKKIPTVRESFNLLKLPITGTPPNTIRLKSNNVRWNNRVATTINRKASLMFKPTEGWKGHIEKDS